MEEQLNVRHRNHRRADSDKNRTRTHRETEGGKT